jgi:hypothetical protein
VAVKVNPTFYPLYKGPKLTQLNGSKATAIVNNQTGNLTLTGTVVTPIVVKPTSPAEESTYTFGIDRGGAGYFGPFPGSPHIRFDAVVVVQIREKGISGYTQYINSTTNLKTTPVALKISQIVISGNTVKVTLPFTTFPSSGQGVNKWTVVFYPRIPAKATNFTDVASLVPEHTNFQLFFPHPKYHFGR